MNRIYRTVWNETTGTWAAAQENAAARGKVSSKKSLAAVIGIIGAGLALAGGWRTCGHHGWIRLA